MLSRFWYLILAALVGASAASAFLLHASFTRQVDTDLEEALRRDGAEMELWLEKESRRRLDSVLGLAADRQVREGLRAASSRRDRTTVEPATVTQLNNSLSRLNQALRNADGTAGGSADLLFAVDKDGRIISQLGGSTPPTGAGLGAFPVVRRALRGWVGDDVWVYNDEVFRVAVRPVIDGGSYVGAIVHGMRLNEQFASQLGRAIPHATIAFFRGERVIAAHVPGGAGMPGSNELELVMSEALASPDIGTRTAPLEVGSGQAVFALVHGSAAHAQVGYVVGRPRPVLPTPFEALQSAADEDIATLPLPLLVGVPFGLVLFGFLFFWLERDKPYAALVKATESLAKGERDRLSPSELRGRYRKLASQINEAVDRAAKASGKAAARAPADLDEILGDAGGGGGGGGGGGAQPYFGFAQDEAAGPGPAPALGGPPAPALGGPPAPPAMAPAAPPPPAPAPPPAAPPPAAPTPAAPTPAAPPPAAPTPAAPDPEPASTSSDSDYPDYEDDDDDDDDGATMIAAIPEELLAKTQSPKDVEEAHFKEVFDKFVKTKRQCGEATAGLTFIKFRGTLEKNKAAIVKRHGAKRVTFTVYVKAGKAALKATPHKS